MKERLRALAEAQGCDAFGVADLDELLGVKPDLFEHINGTYSRAVVMGVRLHEGVLFAESVEYGA